MREVLNLEIRNVASCPRTPSGRSLAMDAVQMANPGHLGVPMASVPLALRCLHQIPGHKPKNPLWLDRNRFILSGGLASMLRYALCISPATTSGWRTKNFRRWESRTQGHPEHFLTPGLETKMGRLGRLVETLLKVRALPDALGKRACECDHGGMGLLPDCALSGARHAARRSRPTSAPEGERPPASSSRPEARRSRPLPGRNAGGALACPCLFS